MGMLQTSLKAAANGATLFNVPHITILWLRHRLQEIRTTWNYPCSGLHPNHTVTWLAYSLQHQWGEWRPSTGAVTETPGCHNAWISTKTMRNHQAIYTACPTTISRPYAPHRESARDLTDCQVRSRNPPPQAMVQLCSVIQQTFV